MLVTAVDSTVFFTAPEKRKYWSNALKFFLKVQETTVWKLPHVWMCSPLINPVVKCCHFYHLSAPCQLCLGVHHLHEEKLVLHRDIKPNNVFLMDSKKIIQLGDFGLAKVLDDGDKQVKAEVRGTCCYPFS